MATIWKSNHESNTNHRTNKGTQLSSWSRQQKIAMIASLALLALLLVVSACSKQASKPALVSVSSPAANSTMPATPTPPATAAAAVAMPAKKKTAKPRPANVSYRDPNSGVSFLYPRKFALATGDLAQPQLAGVGDVPMNFAQSGGVTVATVALPNDSYPDTDFSSAFFNVNVNRNVSEQECEHFAFVDTNNADGEPVDAEKLKIDASNMEMTSTFSASATAQAETQYYHDYENGACYEYVLGLGTEGFSTEDGKEIDHVNRDEVFAKLEKILATVKVKPVETEPVAESNGTAIAAKE